MALALLKNPTADEIAPAKQAPRRVNVRTAEASDVDWLAVEANKFSKFYATKRELFPSVEKAKELLKAMMDAHLFLISEIKGERTGFVAGYYLNHPFNPSIRLLAETFWWVKEEFRAGRSGLTLLNAFVGFGKRHADWITFSLEHKSPVNERTLLKRGFTLNEKSYLLEVD